jgi:hypothetical protein
MKLISCGSCAILLDQDRIQQIPEKWKEDGSINDGWIHDGYKFVPYVTCPFCGNEILLDIKD